MNLQVSSFFINCFEVSIIYPHSPAAHKGRKGGMWPHTMKGLITCGLNSFARCSKLARAYLCICIHYLVMVDKTVIMLFCREEERQDHDKIKCLD